MIDPASFSLSVFFPAYYDEKNIAKTTEGALRAIREMGIRTFEIIIVEDGSPDRTGEVADQLAREHPEVRVIHHPARFLDASSIEVGVTHLPRVDGISTGARPSVIFRTLGEVVRYHQRYRRAKADIRDGRPLEPAILGRKC